MNEPVSPARERRGVVLVLTTAVLWSFNGPAIKLLHEGGTDAWTIAFYRSLFAGLALTPFALRRLGTSRFDPWLLVSVVAFTAMTATFVHATTMTQAANAIVLQYTAPAWVFALSPWLLKERAQRGDVLALAVALAGVAVIFVGQGASADLPGLLVGLASGVTFGLLVMVLRRLRSIDPIVVTWANTLGSALLLLPAAALAADLGVDLRQAGGLAWLGVVQFGLPYLLYTAGLRYVPAYKAILLLLLEPVLNPILTYLFVGEEPRPTTLAGGALIVAAVALQVVFSVRRAR